jgi:hypothetical protein
VGLNVNTTRTIVGLVLLLPFVLLDQVLDLAVAALNRPRGRRPKSSARPDKKMGRTGERVPIPH